MASPTRFERAANNIKAKPLNSQQRVLSVAPLNSRPYIGPPSPGSYTAKAPPTTMDKEAVDKYSPAIVLLPSSSEQEIQNVLAVTKNGVVLTGAAAKGQVGPAVGAMDIAETEDSYFFRVNLPGVAEQGFSCNIEPDGKVLIKGVTTTGEKTVCKNSQVFHMHLTKSMPAGSLLSIIRAAWPD
ncbi:alpha-crystallin domain-containing protein 22.3-like [Quillaja saponaria]|uniref:Alpha-crystallin domain-containing protein 22.3-like n=1 Tax=Quillaja saponaria TaxID=32244 RepID=A0AAD7QAW4_QUISA|nr:alpha-crystallin domain-containing protein 22.3-like [Quillaja saponaria]